LTCTTPQQPPGRTVYLGPVYAFQRNSIVQGTDWQSACLNTLCHTCSALLAAIV
jgi:hypothetical protein